MLLLLFFFFFLFDVDGVCVLRRVRRKEEKKNPSDSEEPGVIVDGTLTKLKPSNPLSTDSPFRSSSDNKTQTKHRMEPLTPRPPLPLSFFPLQTVVRRYARKRLFDLS